MVAGTPTEMLVIFRGYFPEFNPISDNRILMFISLATKIFYKCQDATIYLSAHLLIIANSNGVGDVTKTNQSAGTNQGTLPLSMAKVDKKQASFTDYSNGFDSQYTTTNYGVIYLQLKKTCLGYRLAIKVSGSDR